MKRNYLTIGKITALSSFAIGTFIFTAYYFTSAIEWAMAGSLFIVIAALANLCVLILILVKLAQDRSRLKKTLLVCALMLLNIPVMLFYCVTTIVLSDTMRITFTNATQAEVTDIKVIGCEPESISSLRPGESRTIWVGITGDCALDIEYLSKGKLKRESVAGYLTSGCGSKMEYTIGEK
jgi:hypothetical protein